MKKYFPNIKLFILNIHYLIMVRLSLEDIVEHFEEEDINLNRRQMEALMNLFELNTSELIGLERKIKKYIVRHMFNKGQRERYYSKESDYLFAEIVMRCVL